MARYIASTGCNRRCRRALQSGRSESFSAVAKIAASPLVEEVLCAPGNAGTAQVGRNVVLYSEVLAKVADMEARLVEAGAPQSEIFKLRADGLERMIEEKILESEVERLELRATDSEIDQVHRKSNKYQWMTPNIFVSMPEPCLRIQNFWAFFRIVVAALSLTPKSTRVMG